MHGTAFLITILMLASTGKAPAQTQDAVKGQIATKGQAPPRQDLSKVLVPDDKQAAQLAIKEWLIARGMEVDDRQGNLVMMRAGVLMNLIPIPTAGEIDRIRVSVLFFPKDEFKGTKAFEDLTVKLNKSQNFFQVMVSDEGNLAAAGNITFVDELPAKVFDAYIDAFAQIVKRYVLTEDALKMLK